MTTLTEDLRDIVKSLNKFRRKHSLVHVQIHSVDKQQIDTPKRGRGLCTTLQCGNCYKYACPCDDPENGEDCTCPCTCEVCDCDCDDCEECEECLKRGGVSPSPTLWSEWTPSGFGAPETLMVAINHIDAVKVWSAQGARPAALIRDLSTQVQQDVEAQAENLTKAIAIANAAEQRAQAARAEIAAIKVLVDNTLTAEEQEALIRRHDPPTPITGHAPTLIGPSTPLPTPGSDADATEFDASIERFRRLMVD